MKKLLILLTLAAGAILFACNQPTPKLADARRIEIEKQVLSDWDKINSSILKADAEGYLAHFNAGDFLGMHSEGYRYLNLKDYSDTVKGWFGPRTNTEMKDKKMNVNILSENLALVDQTSMFIATFNDGRVVSMKHAVSFVLKKEQDGWMIIHGHESWRN